MGNLTHNIGHEVNNSVSVAPFPIKLDCHTRLLTGSTAPRSRLVCKKIMAHLFARLKTYRFGLFAVSKDGDRVIHLAVENGDSEVVKLLVDHGADINSSNYKKITPLAVACKLQDWQMVNLLLDFKVRCISSDRLLMLD